MDWQWQLQALGQVALAGLLGGLIGFEREQAHKPAGLRTHMLAAATAALLMDLGEAIVEHFAEVEGSHVSADPIRIMQAIIVGISFLGAGTIITNNKTERVEGLTTAGSVLLTTAIGMTVALSQYVLAVGVTIVALLVLRVVQWAERRMAPPASSSSEHREGHTDSDEKGRGEERDECGHRQDGDKRKQ